MSASFYAKVTLAFGVVLFVLAIMFDSFGGSAHAAGCSNDGCAAAASVVAHVSPATSDASLATFESAVPIPAAIGSDVDVADEVVSDDLLSELGLSLEDVLVGGFASIMSIVSMVTGIRLWQGIYV